MVQSNQLNLLFYQCRTFFPGLVLVNRIDCQRDIGRNAEPGEQRIALENQAAILARTIARFAFDQNRTLIGFGQSGYAIYQSGLAGAGKTENGDKLSVGDVQTDVV